jgi:hypothetical protein
MRNYRPRGAALFLDPGGWSSSSLGGWSYCGSFSSFSRGICYASMAPHHTMIRTRGGELQQSPAADPSSGKILPRHKLAAAAFDPHLGVLRRADSLELREVSHCVAPFLWISASRAMTGGGGYLLPSYSSNLIAQHHAPHQSLVNNRSRLYSEGALHSAFELQFSFG